MGGEMQSNLTSKEIREQVLDQIAAVVFNGDRQGLDSYAMAVKTFPGTPGSVIAEAAAIAWGREEEEWWATVEKTIDGEVIKNAIALAGGKGGAA